MSATCIAAGDSYGKPLVLCVKRLCEQDIYVVLQMRKTSLLVRFGFGTCGRLYIKQCVAKFWRLEDFCSCPMCAGPSLWWKSMGQ